MEKKYRISIKIGDSSFEVESTDEKWVEKKEKEFLEKLPSREEPQGHGKTQKNIAKVTEPTLPPSLTINEFYRKYLRKTKSRPAIAVFLLYYLEKIKKKDKISTGDVQKAFGNVKYPNWNKLNMTDILSNAKRRALANYVNKLWSLTSTGEDYVLSAMAGKSK